MYTSAREIREVSKRAFIGRNTIEVYEYETPYLAGISQQELSALQQNRPYIQSKPKRSNIPTPRTETSVGRTRKSIRRLINANDFNIFLTLTFNRDVTHAEAGYEIKKFNQRMKRQFENWQFLGVAEYTKKGRLHFHLVARIPENWYYKMLPVYKGNNSFNDEWAGLWGNGFAWIQKIRCIASAGSYVSKYLTKEGLDERFFNKKAYYRSRFLELSTIVENYVVDLYLAYAHNSSKVVFQGEFDSPRGRVKLTLLHYDHN